MPDFRILGPLEVSDETGPFLLAGRKHCIVLAVLLLEPGRVVSDDRLIEALSGPEPPAEAAASVQSIVSELRRTLGSAVVESTPSGHRLLVRPGEIDLDRFRVLVDSAQGANAAERATKLRHALALWRGPALADFRSDAFAQPHIAHLEALRMATLEDRIDAELEMGGEDDLVEELEALVHEFPSRERLRALYVRALRRPGSDDDAT